MTAFLTYCLLHSRVKATHITSQLYTLLGGCSEDILATASYIPTYIPYVSRVTYTSMASYTCVFLAHSPH